MSKELNQVYDVFTSILLRIISEEQANHKRRRKGNKKR